MSCIPPETRRLRMIVSPRKRSSGPLDGGFQRMASRGSFILPRDSPDSVISGPGPLMPEKGIAPPLAVTIPCVHARSKRGKAAGQKKNRRGKHFFQGGQVCCTSFAADDGRDRRFHAAGASAQKKKTAPGNGLRMRLNFGLRSVRSGGRGPLISA